MIRIITENEKSCNGDKYCYVFERNGYKTYLTEGKFQQLYNECKNLALPHVMASAYFEIDKLIDDINNNSNFTRKDELLDVGVIRGLELAKRIIGEM